MGEWQETLTAILVCANPGTHQEVAWWFDYNWDTWENKTLQLSERVAKSILKAFCILKANKQTKTSIIHCEPIRHSQKGQ